jgi:tetratricopeptide (TPR) repeat protein
LHSFIYLTLYANAMNPEEYQKIIDYLDTCLSNGQIPDHGPLPGNPEAEQEWQTIRLALEAIRYNALTTQVRTVRTLFEAEQAAAGSDANAPIQKPAEVVKLQQDRAAGIVIRKMIFHSRKFAAAVIIVAGLTGLVKYVLTSPSGVYDKYYSPYELGITRGVSQSSRLEDAYRAGDWPFVVRTFTLDSVKSNKDYFLTAMAYMEQKRYNDAIGLFKTLMHVNEQSKEPYFEDEAEYYLALSYLAMDQTASAIALFNKIKADPGHLFHRRVMNMSDVDMLILHTK